MMSYEYMTQLANDAARESRRKGKVPVSVDGLGDDAALAELRNLPFLGEYVPKGYKRVDNAEKIFGERATIGVRDRSGFLVDSSGFGRPDEPALTFGEFKEVTQKAERGYYYAIREVGQFQVVVAIYTAERSEKLATAAIAKAKGE